ncbi:hypothetical protein RRG08_021240 [Elysia crispata]|uniref:Uncharacterized protein n=1 Tax=Elysia crispata TaxID=231223 RepID=A0AAE0YXY2_9GAST|nr:hypothetical protein RRG08_021240 [Elysia crispata]
MKKMRRGRRNRRGGEGTEDSEENEERCLPSIGAADRIPGELVSPQTARLCFIASSNLREAASCSTVRYNLEYYSGGRLSSLKS